MVVLGQWEGHGTEGFYIRQALPAGGGSGGNGPVVVNGTRVKENAAPARQPLGNLPLWGGAAAGFLAL